MKPLNRKPVHKKTSAKQFGHKVGQTKSINLSSPMPMRGGFRL